MSEAVDQEQQSTTEGQIEGQRVKKEQINKEILCKRVF